MAAPAEGPKTGDGDRPPVYQLCNGTKHGVHRCDCRPPRSTRAHDALDMGSKLFFVHEKRVVLRFSAWGVTRGANRN